MSRKVIIKVNDIVRIEGVYATYIVLKIKSVNDVVFADLSKIPYPGYDLTDFRHYNFTSAPIDRLAKLNNRPYRCGLCGWEGTDDQAIVVKVDVEYKCPNCDEVLIEV